MSVNILLADDHKMIREGLKQLLEMYDDIKVVGEAGDGFECLNLADKTHPDVILLDINMPNLDGYGVLSKIRTNPITAKIPFIFLTAEADSDSQKRAVQLGANDYLTKPVNIRKLFQAIANQLQKVHSA